MNVFISGASTGIGLATSQLFIARGARVIGSVRDQEVGDNLKKELGENFDYVLLDLRDQKAIAELPHLLKSRFSISELHILVNNAGRAYAAPFLEQNFTEITEMIEINVLGLMRLTQSLLPLLGASRPLRTRMGRVINISSISGLVGTPFLAGYVASKHAVEGFSESLRRELQIFGIGVVVIGPGSVNTPIWKKGLTSLEKITRGGIYENSFKKFIRFVEDEIAHSLPAVQVAEAIYHASLVQKPKQRYAVIPRPFRNSILPALLPKSFLDESMAKALGLTKE